MAEVNSKKLKGQKPFASSVMDYLPININMKDGEVQGDYAMIDIGPYDMWAIEYGYTFDKDLKPILAKCTLPEHQYGTDQDTLGPRSAGPPLRLQLQPARLRQEPDEAGPVPPRTAADEVRRRRRELEPGPQRL